MLTAFGQFHEPVGVDQPLLGVSANRAGVSDAVAKAEVGDARANALDHTRALNSRSERQRLRIEAGAMIDVDEVEARRLLTQLDLTGAGLADLDLLPFEDLRPSGLMDSNGVRHGAALNACSPQKESGYGSAHGP